MYVDVFSSNTIILSFCSCRRKKNIFVFSFLVFLSLSLANVWSHKVKKVYTFYIETLLGFFGH